MIALDEIRTAAADASPEFATAAGIDQEALRLYARTVFSEYAVPALGKRLLNMELDEAIVALTAGAWCQGFAAGVYAARVEASS